AKNIGYEAKLLSAVESVNNAQKTILFHRIKQYFNSKLEGKTIAIWGLSFKPNTDDMRDAPSRVLMEALWQAGAKVRAYDPEAMEETQRIYGQRDDLTLCEDPMDVFTGADAMAVLTEWRIFRSPDFKAIINALSNPVIFDGRNVYDPNYLEEMGIEYYGMGRGKSCVSN
ncbi:MAG TPA: UDP-glucose/GDP-mannose dehydrogenase family protein, partial [Gammaproteobacteria bacterium]|nr:UDP-glucose/GDP-mannose dehydrogenase family protein [Gammaproteobacteria bacterium]